MPFSFPPDPLKHGRMLCALGVPDIRGTTSMFFWLSDSFTSSELEDILSSGQRLPLRFNGSKATVQVPGARDVTESKATYVEAPIDLMVDRKAQRVTVDVQGQHAELGLHQWSDWFVWTFEVTSELTVHAISRFYVMQAGEQVHIYMNCLQTNRICPLRALPRTLENCESVMACTRPLAGPMTPTRSVKTPLPRTRFWRMLSRP
jgi:hypothetical protein